MNKPIHTINRQQGSVLLWGLVILLVLTVMGVAASRMAGTDTRIAGNQMMYMLTFQGADSMLRKSATLYEVLQTATNGTAPATPKKGVVKERTLDGSNSYTDSYSNVTAIGVSDMGESQGCPLLKIAITTEMTSDTGGITCRVFTTDVNASLTGTGARSQHSEGVLKPVPTAN
ncbi:MAG: PilX N-terminal domain-containing pilus assembly protein [Thiothrix sp.]|uniref:pilus assembly PilX family protein n=1 Tax=Thiothrix sp. TaxID=1032 RepID=UPI002616A9E0|nr:PilX N-terminal domain-containing pilus assembly protein [Thiothrix sp.]MDD5393759.1 PilX N-terminal domain-containing pilus assembly protein [Thiothrix sp.]